MAVVSEWSGGGGVESGEWPVWMCHKQGCGVYCTPGGVVVVCEGGEWVGGLVGRWVAGWVVGGWVVSGWVGWYVGGWRGEVWGGMVVGAGGGREERERVGTYLQRGLLGAVIVHIPSF